MCDETEISTEVDITHLVPSASLGSVLVGGIITISGVREPNTHFNDAYEIVARTGETVRARRVSDPLTETYNTDPDGSIPASTYWAPGNNSGVYVAYCAGDKCITLDGDFTAEELEFFIEQMRK